MAKVHIVSDPQILGGKPIIQGTRISVELIMDLVASGMSFSEIQKEYPHLSLDQIQSAVSYAALRVKREKIIPTEIKRGQVIFETP